MLEILGDYKIIRQLGEGTLGLIFLAEHRFIKKQVVLTILPEDLSLDKEFIIRLEEEIGRVADLNHPNIIKLQTVSFADPYYFLVSDCYDTTLSEKKPNFKEEEVFSLLTAIAKAIDYAHPKVTHGILNLTNILFGEQSQVYLGSMGLAKIVGKARVISNTLVQATKNNHEDYSFLAPEQKRENLITPSCDVYAFGVLAYYLLTGFFPEGIFEMPSKLCPTLRYDWDLLINKTLQRDPNRRASDLMPLLDVISRSTMRALTEEMKKEEPLSPSLKFETLLPQVEEKIPVFATVEIRNDSEEVGGFEKITSYVPKNMMVVPGGSFLRGSNEGSRDEMPRHTIQIDSFAIDIHPVTNEEFIKFLEFNGGEKDENHDLIRLKNSRLSRAAGKLHIETGYGKHPVVGVSWYGALAYAKWVGKRLPTEAEWEIAALGGQIGPYPTGESIEKNQANFFSSDTTAVMSYPANGFGLYDMVGNVYEWCQDWYGYNYYETTALDSKRPKGPIQGVYRVLRGGCWKSLKDDLRCSHRHRNNPGAVNGTYGFRLACDV